MDIIQKSKGYFKEDRNNYNYNFNKIIDSSSFKEDGNKNNIIIEGHSNGSCCTNSCLIF